MSAPVKVAIVGATGRTGSVIVDSLLASKDTKFEVTALSRASSVNSEANQDLAKRGVQIVQADLTGPKEDLVKALTGIDVVISVIVFTHFKDQIPLAEAAKEAGIKRFMPCFWGTPAPRGIQMMYDQKLDVLDAVKRLHLPYTTLDVGWWSQQMIPAVPSGRTDHGAFPWFKEIPGDGNVRMTLTDLRDIGDWTARIITDPRTLNKQVLAYTDVMTINEMVSLMGKLSGEKVALPYRSAEAIEEMLKRDTEILKTQPDNNEVLFNVLIYQYMHSWGVRGDSTPEVAEYLGYLDATKLYPDVKGITLEQLYTDVLEGKPSGFIEPKNFDMDSINIAKQ